MIDYSLHFNNVFDFYVKIKSALGLMMQVEYIGEGNGFSGFIKMIVPELLDSSYCENLGKEFEQEMRENFHRFVETKRQDRYSGELFRLLRLYLDMVFRAIKEYHTFSENADYILINSDGEPITGKVLEDAVAVDKSLKNLNKIRLPIHDLLKSNAPEEWQKYYSALNSHNQEPQQTGISKSLFKNLPPKVLLLDKLGFFKLPEVQELTWESKGKLVSALCGGSADNAVDYIRQCDPKRLALEKNPYRNQTNVKVVQDLLDSLNGS